MKSSKIFLLLLIMGIFTNCVEDSSLSDSGLTESVYDTGGFRLSGDSYNLIEENPFINVVETPVSTFSIDADGASYANIRRFIQPDNQLLPKAAIRTEELINYFDLEYPYSDSNHLINLNEEISECP